MTLAEERIAYHDEIDENQRQVREMVLESYKDIEEQSGKECEEIFKRLEKKYSEHTN